jgi:hypothetical protein
VLLEFHSKSLYSSIDFKENMKSVKERGIDVILQFGKYKEGHFYTSLSTDMKMLEEFLKFLFNALDEYSADGFLLEWLWAGCTTPIVT